MPGKPVIAVVTGASRGAGAGIARALGAHGAVVYVTGRSEANAEPATPGTIQETAAAVTALGDRAFRCGSTMPTTIR